MSRKILIPALFATISMVAFPGIASARQTVGDGPARSDSASTAVQLTLQAATTDDPDTFSTQVLDARAAAGRGTPTGS